MTPSAWETWYPELTIGIAKALAFKTKPTTAKTETRVPESRSEAHATQCRVPDVSRPFKSPTAALIRTKVCQFAVEREVT